MKFLLLSPEKKIFDGEADSVTIPGTKGIFTVWPHHASLITTIEKGEVVCKAAGLEQKFLVDGGFAEVKDNVVSVCIERLITTGGK
jgi:F-type H+-transporting ATPase subunit epsilon